MSKRQPKTIKDFNWRFGVKLAALIAGLGAGAAYASSRYTIGLDTQTHRCLDEWIFVIDKWKKPTAFDVSRNDYVAFAISAAQTPPNALFAPGHVMVKRAVATDAGDLVTIDTDGISFSHGSEIWAHGTALEAAASLGSSQEEYVREFALSAGQLFMMGDNEMSYDGRYYGPINESQIVGSVVWAW